MERDTTLERNRLSSGYSVPLGYYFVGSQGAGGYPPYFWSLDD